MNYGCHSRKDAELGLVYWAMLAVLVVALIFVPPQPTPRVPDGVRRLDLTPWPRGVAPVRPEHAPPAQPPARPAATPIGSLT